MSLIEAQSVGLSLGHRTILEQINLQVRSGEIVTLIGPNGAGKTSLLKILLGLIPPSRGKIRKKQNLRIGYLPQRFTLDAVIPLTVSRLMRLTQEVTETAMLKALEDTGVSHLLHQSVQSLSGGELQRVLLARAFLRDPDLLVLDEPMQGVDYASEASLYALIANLKRRNGCGILLVSHDLHVVMGATDRVVCLNRCVCCEGEPSHVSQHPEFTKLFGEGVANSFAIYQHHHKVK